MSLLQPAVLSDLPDLVRLHRAIQALHAALDPSVYRAEVDPDALAALWRERLAQPDCTVLLAGRGAMAVGCICFELQDRPGDALTHAARRIYVHHLAVDVAARREGIGTLLLRAAEDAARDRGIAVMLAALHGNGPATRFYQSRGYAPTTVMLRLDRAVARADLPPERLRHSPGRTAPLSGGVAATHGGGPAIPGRRPFAADRGGPGSGEDKT